MTVQSWLEAACADADRRGMPEIKPLLESLARAMQSLRDADDVFGHPARQHANDGSTSDRDPS
jgi:hypothetical protein